MAACGAGGAAGLARSMLHVKETVEPDPALTALYDARYAEFKQIYPACKTLFANLAKGAV